MHDHDGRRRWLGVGLGIIAGFFLMIDYAKGQDPAGDAILARFESMVTFNLDNPQVMPSSQIDSLMQTIAGRAVGERIAFWADFFYRQGKAHYLFGLDSGGYVKEGRLCDDFQTDCVLFVYRMTELGRSSTAREAVQFAFGTRFYGASVEDAILADGRVRYEDPSHLDYSEDIFRTGIWGKDETSTVGPTEPDPGNELFAPDTLFFVRKDKIDESTLQSGDVVYFVLDETNPKGKEARGEGVLISHLGIVKRSGNGVDLIHAAKSPLEGIYEGGKVEKVPLRTYLDAIDRFKGIVVTRIEEF